MIWTLVRELIIALLAIVVGLVGATIGVGALGDANFAFLAVITVLPLGALGLVLAFLYGWKRPAAHALRWSLLVALIGGLLVAVALTFTGTMYKSWAAIGYLFLLVMPGPLLQGLASGLIAQRRARL